MNTITQDMRFKQAVIEYTLKHGVTTAAIRYKTSRQNIYRWRKKYDGTVHSLAEGSHRPHSHPNQHTEEEIKLVKNIRRRNPHAGLVVFWVKLRQRGYTRSISGPHKLLCRIDGKPVKLPNPKYIPKPYEQMQYPGQRVQIDVKFVPQACIIGQEDGTKWYQYTFIDEYSRFRYLEAFEENSTYSSTQFLKHVVEKFPFAIECVQTDNGFEFTNEMGNSQKTPLTMFETARHPPQEDPAFYAQAQRQGRTQPPQGQRVLLCRPQILFLRGLCQAASCSSAQIQPFPHPSS